MKVNLCKACLPQLDSLVVGGQKEVGWILPLEPPDLVDLLFDLQTLQVVELWLVALEGGVDIVFAPPGKTVLAGCVPLEDDHPAPLVSCCQKLPILVELHARNDVGWESNFQYCSWEFNFSQILNKNGT